MNRFPLSTTSKFDRSGRARRYLIVASLIIGQLLAVPFLLPQRTQACGPFFTDAIFVFSKHPDFPLDNAEANWVSSANRGPARIWWLHIEVLRVIP
jgi:hypothetical protein